jgi:hypothetical protein
LAFFKLKVLINNINNNSYLAILYFAKVGNIVIIKIILKNNINLNLYNNK